MGKTNKKAKNRRGQKQSASLKTSNFVAEAGPGCYIARKDTPSPWLIEWESVDPAQDFDSEEVPDIAIDPDESTLTVCNVGKTMQIAYVTVYEAKVVSGYGELLAQGTTTTNTGEILNCVTFIVLNPPETFAHLCYIDEEDLTGVRIESDVRDWSQHPTPSDEHPFRVGFPLQGGPFLCTQGENGALTHFFSGNLHAIDFACPIGTPLLAVADGVIVETKDGNTLTGIAVSNLFEWNSILMKVQQCHEGDEKNKHHGKADKNALFVEYVHIQKSDVKVGDIVQKGQVIGRSGSVGFSPEPHLHFSAFRSAESNAPTVRVRFESGVDCKGTFLPVAGKWYDHAGLTEETSNNE